MPCIAFAVRPIDVAIFATLGLLWIFGGLFIVVLYRWIRRFEREQDSSGPGVVSRAVVEEAAPERPAKLAPTHAVARDQGKSAAVVAHAAPTAGC